MTHPRPADQRFSSWVAGLKSTLESRIPLKNFKGEGLGETNRKKIFNQGHIPEAAVIRALHTLAAEMASDYMSATGSPSAMDLIEWARAEKGGDLTRGPKSIAPAAPAWQHALKICTVVSAAPHGHHASPPQFYRGSAITPALLAAECDFRRSVTLGEAALPYPKFFGEHIQKRMEDAVAGIEQPILLITGPGGVGKTTLLRRTAYDLAAKGADRGWLVLQIEDARILDFPSVLHDVQFAGRQPKVTGIAVFVDEASAAAHLVTSLAKRMGVLRTPFLCVMAEQANKQFMFDRGRIDFHLGKLTETEIQRLEEKLEEHDCLGALKPLSPADRRRQLGSKLVDRELLVALRCATEGNDNFDDITRREYDLVPTERAKMFYRIVALLDTCGYPLPVAAAEFLLGAEPEERRRTRECVHETVEFTPRVGFRARSSVYARVIVDNCFPLRASTTPDDLCSDVEQLLLAFGARTELSAWTASRIAQVLLRHPVFLDRVVGTSLIARCNLPLLAIEKMHKIRALIPDHSADRGQAERKWNPLVFIPAIGAVFLQKDRALGLDFFRWWVNCDQFPLGDSHGHNLASYADALDPQKDPSLIEEAITILEKLGRTTTFPHPRLFRALGLLITKRNGPHDLSLAIEYLIDALRRLPSLKANAALVLLLEKLLLQRNRPANAETETPADRDAAIELLQQCLAEPVAFTDDNDRLSNHGRANVCLNLSRQLELSGRADAALISCSQYLQTHGRTIHTVLVVRRYAELVRKTAVFAPDEEAREAILMKAEAALIEILDITKQADVLVDLVRFQLERGDRASARGHGESFLKLDLEVYDRGCATRCIVQLLLASSLPEDREDAISILERELARFPDPRAARELQDLLSACRSGTLTAETPRASRRRP